MWSHDQHGYHAYIWQKSSPPELKDTWYVAFGTHLVCLIDDHWLTLTYFTARSALVIGAFL